MTAPSVTVLHLPHPILAALLERDIPVLLDRQGWRVEGFYKHGSVLLQPLCDDAGHITAFRVEGRYGWLGTIRTFAELVGLHYDTWATYRTRADVWAQPDRLWVADYTAQGLVRRIERTIVTYE